MTESEAYKRQRVFRRQSAGEILLEFYLKPKKLTIPSAAKKSKISISQFRKIVRGEALITNYTASKLSKTFNTSKNFWLNLQAEHISDETEYLLSTDNNRKRLKKGIRQDQGLRTK